MRALHLAVSALVLTLAPIAQAEESYTRTIAVAPADLSSPEAVSALHARVVRASTAVCREAMLATSPHTMRAVRACAVETTDEAIAVAAIPALIAYHAAETDTPFSAEVETLASR